MPCSPATKAYGYGGRLDEILRNEYNFDGVYLDNAAAPLVARSIAFKSAEYIVSNPLVNPHSKSYWGQKTLDLVNKVRSQVLTLMNTDTDHYDLVFTASATAALKLVGECIYKYNFMYLRDSHTSVVGLRALSKSFNSCTDIDGQDIDTNWIVSYPLQSNFDGTRYPFEWVQYIAKMGAISLVDISAFCSTCMPDLNQLQPDLAVLSFYKLFGLPDLGALIVRKSPRIHHLFENRKYAGGGTVSSLAPQLDYMVRNEDLCTSLEDGTLPFHSIATLHVAIMEFNRIFGGFDAISAHCDTLAAYCYRRLSKTNLCTLWSPDNGKRGPIITFTLKNAGYHEFANVSSKLNIHVRTGTLCNVGAFTLKSDIDDMQLINNHKYLGKTCSDEQDIIDGQETGVIRASFGPYSTFSDVDRLVDCITTYFSKQDSSIEPLLGTPADAQIIQLIIYPIKSCAGTSVDQTTTRPRGLKWDREFCLVDMASLEVLSLKKNLIMASIRSIPIEEQGILQVSYKGKTLDIALDSSDWTNISQQNSISICGPRQSDLYFHEDPVVVEFFSSILGKRCTIARMIDQEARHSRNKSSMADVPLTLSNSSPILLISSTSSDHLGDQIDFRVFRANIVIKTMKPFDEDQWKQIKIGPAIYDVLGPCRRCNMVCVSRDGCYDPTPYLALTKSRRINGKLWFGQHIQLHDLDSCEIKIGMKLICIAKAPVLA